MTDTAHDRRRLSIDRFELKLAREVERLLFPKGSPAHSWNRIEVRNRTAGVLGGDYFDFISLPDSSQAVFIGDVTGHGLHASVIMSLVYGFIHHAALEAFSPCRLVAQVNDFLVHFAERSKSVDQYFSTTLFLGIVSPKTLVMDYVNAGHVPPVIRRGDIVLELGPTAQPLGYFRQADITGDSFHFAQGDRLLLYTDGIIEAANAAGERFGTGRLKELLGKKGLGASKVLDRIFTAIRDFGVSEPPEDDCTALVMDVLGIAR